MDREEEEEEIKRTLQRLKNKAALIDDPSLLREIKLINGRKVLKSWLTSIRANEPGPLESRGRSSLYR